MEQSLERATPIDVEVTRSEHGNIRGGGKDVTPFIAGGSGKDSETVVLAPRVST